MQDEKLVRGIHRRQQLEVEPDLADILVFVVARNSEYRALKEFTQLMHAPDTPGMELPGMDIPGIAASYGVQSERVTSLSDLTRAVKDALSADAPRLIEISQRRLADS
jgi:benzoylformate decarboxylase